MEMNNALPTAPCLTALMRPNTGLPSTSFNSKTQRRTLYLYFQNSAQLNQPTFQLTIGDAQIVPSPMVRNLGVILDSHLNMEAFIKSTCRAAFFHLYRIARIRRYLSNESAAQLVHAFIISRLDYCNSLLIGLSSCKIKPLQPLKNCAARLLRRSRQRDHIKPHLQALHWLPVQFRIEFKIALITTNV